MGWMRTIFLGDVGNRLTEADLRSLAALEDTEHEVA